MRILAIETSCDETAISIADFSGGTKNPKIKILSNIISSQVKLHAPFGGVVPNLAKREHQKNLVPVLLKALKKAKLVSSIKYQVLSIRKQKILNTKYSILNTVLEREPELLEKFKKHVLPLRPPKIDAIAVTYGPGLEPALWVGINFAKALSYIWGKPIIPVDHMKGHLFSAFLQKRQRIPNFQSSIFKPEFPVLALLVSGGHTELVLMRGWNKFKIVGETLDDAAGEAFDKVARLLGLYYPGGPTIAKEAGRSQNSQITNHNFQTNPKSEILNRKITLPRPMINSKDFNFSFSGLKTAVLYLTRDLGPEQTKKLRPQIAAEFQNAVVDVLISKTIRAAKKYKVKTILLGGGVAANDLLRQRLAESCQLIDIRCRLVDRKLSGDNALMIATAAHFKWVGLAPKERATYFSKKPLAKLEARKTTRSTNWRIRAVGNLRLKH